MKSAILKQERDYLKSKTNPRIDSLKESKHLRIVKGTDPEKIPE